MSTYINIRDLYIYVYIYILCLIVADAIRPLESWFQQTFMQLTRTVPLVSEDLILKDCHQRNDPGEWKTPYICVNPVQFQLISPGGPGAGASCIYNV